jgi:hypothetical protein
VLVALSVGGTLRAAELPTGKVVRKVVCRGDPTRSYALYLPPDYTAQKRWPVLYCFDAGARGAVPVRLFSEGAALCGVIVAGSLNSRNGPWEPNLVAIRAMWEDTHKRFAIDDTQVFTTGFSGGSRVASEVAFLHPEEVVGVIGCSAGFRSRQRSTDKIPFVYYGTAGTTDFNLYEMRMMDRRLDAAGVPHRVKIFDGGHHWPPKALCTRALIWVTLQAMRRNVRERDPALLSAIAARELAAIARLEKKRALFDAYQRAAEMREDLQGLHDVPELEPTVKRLEAEPAVKAGIRRKAEEERKSVELLARLRRDLGRLSKSAGDQQKVAELVRAHGKIATARKVTEEVMLSRRFLMEAHRFLIVRAEAAIKRDDHAAAIGFYRSSLVISDRDPRALYNLACSYARTGRAEEALSALQRAVARGFRDARHMAADPDLATLRDRKQFKDLLKTLEGSKSR